MGVTCVRMKDRREEERPYERCLRYGESSLTDAELLAILLRTGTRDKDVLSLANDLIHGKDADLGICSLLHYTYDELIRKKGIGKVKAVQILALKELLKRLWKSSPGTDRVKLSSTEACADYYLQDLRHLEKEEVRVAFLDMQYRLIADCLMTRGTADMSLISVRDILEAALKHHAEYVLLLHNHPYSSELPSDEDRTVTEMVNKGCKAIGIKLIDHIIIGERGFFSFKERGFIN